MTFKFVVKQRLHANDIINVFHYADDNGVSGADIQAIVDGLALAYETHLVPNLADSWSFEGIDFYDTDNPAGTPGIPYTPTGGLFSGDVAIASAANQLAVLINWKCQQGPPFRGRSYMAGWTEGLMGGVGNITQGIVDNCQLFADDIREIPVTGGSTAQLVIYSTGSSQVPVGTTAVVTSATVNNFPKTQRRRALGTGS